LSNVATENDALVGTRPNDQVETFQFPTADFNIYTSVASISNWFRDHLTEAINSVTTEIYRHDYKVERGQFKMINRLTRPLGYEW
jgi:hypothetical protein